MFMLVAVLDLYCCVGFFSSCGEWGHSSLLCVGFSLQWLLLLRSMALGPTGFSTCGMWGLLTGLVTLQHVGSSQTRD